MTPLKKRRLARESLSTESVSESPAQTPTPSASNASTSSTGYFASLTESFENFKNSNGINMLFSPMKHGEADVKSEAKPSENNVEVQCDSQPDNVAVDSGEVDKEASVSTVGHREGVVEMEVVNCVSSCSADMDSSVSGGVLSECVDDVLISNTEAKSSEVDSVGQQADGADQLSQVCDVDNVKCANSEPDSSDTVQHVEEGSHIDVECDSGSGDPQTSCADSHSGTQVSTNAEVDSSESADPSVASATSRQETSSENNQCDSCNSEQTDMLTPVLSNFSNVADVQCSSSNLSSNLNYLSVNESISSRNTVDSSTDDVQTQSEGVSGSVSEPVSLLSLSHLATLDSRSTASLYDNEVSNSLSADNVQSNLSSTLPVRGTGGLSDSYLSSSSSSLSTPGQNRHLRFLNESNYSTDSMVDSTTQFMPGLGASNMMHSPAFPGAVNYDSDSMDVTSASEPGYMMAGDERRMSDDSMSGFSESFSSMCAESSQPPKEKKKVQNLIFNLICF